MRGALAAAALVLLGGCAGIAGLSSFSDGDCSGGDCDAGSDAASEGGASGGSSGSSSGGGSGSSSGSGSGSGSSGGGACNAASCPGGCCSGDTCVPYASQSAVSCGTAGAACAPCANGLCDTTSGTCSCDARTCTDGCCSGGLSGTCKAFSSMTTASCGAGGAACDSCPGGCCMASNGGTCATTHSNGLGQSYYDCNPLYSTSNPWTSAAALEACAAFTGDAAKCSTGNACGTAISVCSSGYTVCDCWEYTGSQAGHVNSSNNSKCYCLISGDPSWD